MISRTFLLRRTLPVIGHHAVAAADAAPFAANHYRQRDDVDHDLPLFAPIVPLQVRRGWLDDEDEPAPASPSPLVGSTTASFLPPLIQLRWEDFKVPTLPSPSPSPIVEQEMTGDAPSPSTTQAVDACATTNEISENEETPAAELTTSQIEEESSIDASTNDHEREVAVATKEGEKKKDPSFEELEIGQSPPPSSPAESLNNELPEFNDIRSNLSRPSTIRLRLKSQADAVIILFMLEQPKKYRLQLAGFLARLGLKRQKQITRWFPEMKEPLRQFIKANQKPREELPESIDVRARLSSRSKARLRLKSQADAAIILAMIERPQQHRLQLAGFLSRLGLKRQKKIMSFFPELKYPLRRFIKIAMSGLR